MTQGLVHFSYRGEALHKKRKLQAWTSPRGTASRYRLPCFIDGQEAKRFVFRVGLALLNHQ